MNIAIVSSEIVPFAKTGGLADVSGALGKYLSFAGYDVRLFTPMYDMTSRDATEFQPAEDLRDIPIVFGGEDILCSVEIAKLPDSEAEVYFIDSPGLYDRGKIYTEDGDEYLRFAVLCRAVLESCQHLEWAPDVIHCNDWQSALIPLYLRTLYAWGELFGGTKTILAIHNLAYQGAFRGSIVDHLGFAEDHSLLHQDDLRAGVFNYMKHGIMYANAISTVSQTYAAEIQTPEYGEGLNEMLSYRSDALFGIVNGVDYEEWNPEGDMLIPHHYSLDDLQGKVKNKKNLLEQLELPYDPNVPVFGIVSRLVYQKGFDLFCNIMEPFLRHIDLRLCVLGSGADEYEKFFQSLNDQYPEKVCFYNGYSNELAHLIEAGADIFLMPSRYEPCGLNQIYSLKYGTIPIVRKTGGLADTVQQFNPETGEGNGFVFEDFNPHGLAWGIEQALEVWNDKKAWKTLMKNAMSANWSWEKQIDKYVELYERVM
ncbi:MAG: glycogen synthase [Chlorobi bacterium]|nr:glycogen synthase [Chlorobiota bacterium]